MIVSVVAGIAVYILYLQWKNRRKSNKVNLLEYEKKREDLRKTFNNMSDSDKLERFNRETEKYFDDQGEGRR